MTSDPGPLHSPSGQFLRAPLLSDFAPDRPPMPVDPRIAEIEAEIESLHADENSPHPAAMLEIPSPPAGHDETWHGYYEEACQTLLNASGLFTQALPLVEIYVDLKAETHELTAALIDEPMMVETSQGPAEHPLRKKLTCLREKLSTYWQRILRARPTDHQTRQAKKKRDDQIATLRDELESLTKPKRMVTQRSRSDHRSIAW